MTLDELTKVLTDFTNQHQGEMQVQAFFLAMYKLALQGMNVGAGGDVGKSGEQFALKRIESLLAQRYPNTPYVLFDVGAYVGSFTKTALEVLNQGLWRIYCFEPNTRAFAAINAGFAPYIGKTVFPFNTGVGAEPGTMPLFGNGPGSVLGSLYQRRLDHFGISMEKVDDVPITSIDHFCDEHGIDHIHFLKLDVEGHEIKCLQGAARMLEADRIDFLQFEFGGCNIDSKTYFQDFWYLLKDFRIYRILKDGLFEIEKYSEKEEIFNTQNFIAERRR